MLLLLVPAISLWKKSFCSLNIEECVWVEICSLSILKWVKKEAYLTLLGLLFSWFFFIFSLFYFWNISWLLGKNAKDHILRFWLICVWSDLRYLVKDWACAETKQAISYVVLDARRGEATGHLPSLGARREIKL